MNQQHRHTMPNPEPSEDAVTASRLLTATWGFAVLATVLATVRHSTSAVLAGLPEGGLSTVPLLSTVPHLVWAYAAGHVVLALVALGLGYLLLSWAYPMRGLAAAARAGNPAAAIQAAAHVLGAAAVACACWGGADAGSVLISAVFSVLGWGVLAGACAGHRLVTRYADHEEIQAGNVAAALASAGLHVGIAIVVARAMTGPFVGWPDSLSGFAGALIWILLLWPLRQILLARVILRLDPKRLDTAVMQRQDPWLGAAEALAYVLAALCLSASW